MNHTNGLGQWARDNNWALLITGLVVVLIASILVFRALRRVKAVRAGQTFEQRDARARRMEDGLTIAVAIVASGLSLTGLWKYAHDVLGLRGLWQALPYFGLDAAVIVCAIRARRRARGNEAAGWNGRLVWIFAFISAAFGFSEGGSLWAGFGRAVWPLIAATLFELGLIEQRHAAQRNVKRRLNLGWAHPIERLRVYSVLSADSTLTADEATHEVRVNAAAKALNRLRNADTAAAVGGRLARAKLRRVEHRTQRVLLRAKFSDPQVTAEVLQRTQALVRTRDFARMDYSALDEARAMMTDAIDHTVISTHKRPRPAARRPEQQPAERAPQTSARVEKPAPAPIEPSAPAPADAAVDQDARDPKEIVRAIFDEMIQEEDVRPDAAEVRRRAGFPLGQPPVPATVRTWVKGYWEAREAARAEDAAVRADWAEHIDARASMEQSARDELSIADPVDAVDDEIETEAARGPRHAAHVA